MEYNELALETFIKSLNVNEDKQQAIKNLYIDQLEHLVKEEVTVNAINDVNKLNTLAIKGANFFKNIGEDFKKNVSNFFEEDKKEK